ncbi:MAG: exopolyphosphatase/guanosine-5'-triphosphate,3'-diphosphate pyrophosphatase [Pseudohongiellaceae bacterium]|jgi:exopolyphosphatase/guanosine-5'-triphosphate,3'-diphosphate pyrophosphatase
MGETPQTIMTKPPPEGLAAIDIGSNSIRMLLVNLVGGEPVVVDRIREQVRLAEGLDSDGLLDDDAFRRALACLDRFGQRLRNTTGLKVRAVATNTLRVATNAADLLREAEEVLGHRIEVISGQEEARLIYLGIAHTLADDEGSRLVVDIGGGSTECIVGERFEPIEAHSLYMGCVRWTQRFFADGKITEKRMRAGHLAASRELQTLRATFRGLGWEEAVGSSGTIRSCASILEANEWCEEGIDRPGLQRLSDALVSAGHGKKIDLPGMRAERRMILAGGVSILCAVFDSLGIERMAVSKGTLREGVLYDLLGRIRHEDVRERTIRDFQDRFDIDTAQAERVEATALRFLKDVAPGWQLESSRHQRFLGWAARLHELGLRLAYRHHHRHGAYILANADMPGFSGDDQEMLASIVGHQRRKFGDDPFKELLRSDRRRMARRLTVLLRLALLVNRSRSAHPEVPLALSALGSTLRLTVPQSWLASRPLTRSDLEDEVAMLQAVGLKVTLVIDPD